MVDEYLDLTALRASVYLSVPQSQCGLRLSKSNRPGQSCFYDISVKVTAYLARDTVVLGVFVLRVHTWEISVTVVFVLVNGGVYYIWPQHIGCALCFVAYTYCCDDYVALAPERSVIVLQVYFLNLSYEFIFWSLPNWPKVNPRKPNFN